ncbi:MAG: hypothetical protein ABJB05_07700 [Parafilimonas sp.]
MDALMVVGTWALAIITFLALRKDGNEKMQSLQSQLSTLKYQLQQISTTPIKMDSALYPNEKNCKGSDTMKNKIPIPKP